MRSWMFVPGNSSRYLAKAAGSTADAVFLDLEDGVPPADKVAARELVAQTLQTADFAPQRFVRLNAVDTPGSPTTSRRSSGTARAASACPRSTTPRPCGKWRRCSRRSRPRPGCPRARRS
ncbi:aldolase/citrate lyase family protein [Blastococcus brunescens]|uniref:Aldolase/citrate lyase family protein n=1 Tax=Blastococcus brunescens TaxID=1564165 RepID=A0ABZ1BBD1_9ACTN|nr:aldolase/citrate lyase family protein [Blastococcus sp. BMG 8361]WRL67216.1 aldolase/citrate lyase family protein [Blastococcus sp. BMG 8361]